MMSPGADTKQRILDAAERLFSTDGIARTSLRAITLEAGVNVAAVHYHFGSKEALLEVLVARHVEPVNRERLARLDRVETGAGEGAPALEGILEAFIAPSFRVLADLDPTGPTPAQLIARFYSEPGDVVQDLLREHFGEVGRRFLAAFARALPDLPPAELTWRFQFMVAVLTHLLAGLHLLDVVPGHRVQAADEAATIRRAVGFLAAGFRAPAEGIG